MAHFIYRCPGCGAQYELRQLNTVKKRYCSCGAEIRPQAGGREQMSSGLMGCGAILMLVLGGVFYFSRKEPQPAPVPTPVVTTATPTVVATPTTPPAAVPGGSSEPTILPMSAAASSESPRDNKEPELEADLPANPRDPEVVERIPGKVTAVVNGDTVKFLNNYHQQFEVRLEGIDAPEIDQQHGNKAKEALASFVLGKEIVLGKTGVDRYDRILGFLFLGPVDVNLQMIEDGWGWHFKKYNSNSKYRFAEERAKAGGLGLWKSDNVIPPWEHRDLQRQRQ